MAPYTPVPPGYANELTCADAFVYLEVIQHVTAVIAAAIQHQLEALIGYQRHLAELPCC